TDGWMLGQHFFDLPRPDLEPARFDQIFLAIDDEQVAVVVQIAEIAGVQPPRGSLLVGMVAQDDGRLLGLVPVADHQLPSGERDFPDAVRRHGTRAIRVVEYAHAYSGHRNP